MAWLSPGPALVLLVALAGCRQDPPRSKVPAECLRYCARTCEEGPFVSEEESCQQECARDMKKPERRAAYECAARATSCAAVWRCLEHR